MASPSVAITRLDLSMSYGEFNLEASRRGFIGLSVLPGIGVAADSADFAKISVEELLRPVEDTARAARTTYKRDTFEWIKDSYALAEHGVEEIVDDLTIERYNDVIRAETIHTNRGIHRVLQALENDIAALLFTAGFTYKTAVGTAWSTHATATPIDDIDGAQESVKTQLGMEPNALILTDHGLRHFKRCAQVEDLLKYSSKDDPKSLGAIAGIMALFELEHVFVARSFKNAAKEGQTASFSRFWDATMAMVARVDNDGMDGDLENPDPSLGRTVFAQDEASLPGADDGESSLIIEEYREENRRGGVIRARNKRQAKIIHEEAGHLLTGVTA